MWRFFKKTHNSLGFTLVEVIVAAAVFTLFAAGTWGAMQMSVKAINQSKLTALKTALLTEKVELARGLPYDSVGVAGGSVTGVLPASTTTVRDGINFLVTFAVNMVDDPFNGSGADYKKVDIGVRCMNCNDTGTSKISTLISPKITSLSGTGALFVLVNDAAGQPVSGATVTVTSTATTTSGLTGTDGFYRLYNVPTGTSAYNIRVTKAGFSSDYTVTPDATNPNPYKPPATVVNQMITQVGFAIDKVGSMSVLTVDNNCNAVGSVLFNLSGNKLLGPAVKKFSRNFTTNLAGSINIPNLEWDQYIFDILTATYDLSGSTPLLPISLGPGMNQTVTLQLVPHSGQSLRVTVLDGNTILPLSDAQVELTRPGFPSFYRVGVTGVGSYRQTDWTGGVGSSVTNQYTSQTNLQIDAGGLQVQSPATSGSLDSATIDLGGPVSLGNISYNPSITSGATDPVQLQLAYSNSSSPASWNFKGPDGTSGTYYTAATSSLNVAGTYRYIRYRVILNTVGGISPTVSQVAVTYTNGCTAPGQVFFPGLPAADDYGITVTRTGYSTVSTTVTVSGNTETTISMPPTGPGIPPCAPPPSCGAGLSACISGSCSITCTDLKTDADHCGTCGTDCAAPTYGTAKCNMGSCDFDCPFGFTKSTSPVNACIPPLCIYSVGAWGSCSLSGGVWTQSRTVTATNPPCTPNSPPPTTQTCPACIYSAGAWGACTYDGTSWNQTRTVTITNPPCAPGVPPASSQGCPAPSCTYTYSAWGACTFNGSSWNQTRTVSSALPVGCTGTPGPLTQGCTPPTCTYTYSAWGACTYDGSSWNQTRTILSTSPAGCTGTPDPLTQGCPAPPCTYTYSPFVCAPTNIASRSVVSALPPGCTGTPGPLTQTCDYCASIGKTLCNFVCVNTQTDNSNCGSCGNICSAPYNGYASACTTGTCDWTCNSGYTKYNYNFTGATWAPGGSGAACCPSGQSICGYGPTCRGIASCVFRCTTVEGIGATYCDQDCFQDSCSH